MRLSLCLSLALSACAGHAPAVGSMAEGAPVAAQAPAPVDYAAVVAAPDRLDEDRALDGVRKPAAWLDFFQVRPGQRVLELGAGGGYSTELLARVIGPSGQVYSQNPLEWAGFAEQGWAPREAAQGMGWITRYLQPFDQPLPEGVHDLDAALAILIYHDIHNLPADRAAMNAALFAALRPGGLYGVIDHHAAAGAGLSATETLHRVERDTVISEILAAGFVLEAEADFLADPQDTRDTMAFARPQPPTDRFVLRFRKPDAP